MYNNKREGKCKNEIKKIQTIVLHHYSFFVLRFAANIIENIYIINNLLVGKDDSDITMDK